MWNLDWVTEDHYKQACIEAKEIFDDFYADKSEGEETWTEIQIGDKSYDVNCWDENIDACWDENDEELYDKRVGPVHCILHATYETQNGEWRETDGDLFIRLFSQLSNGDVITYEPED